LRSAVCGHRGLEFETSLAGCVSKRFHFAMVLVAPTVENDPLHIFRSSAFGDELADFRRCGDIGAPLLVGTQFSFGGVHRRERLARPVINDLRRNVALGEMDSQSRALRGSSHLLSKALMA
jgi:hypothetical protein